LHAAVTVVGMDISNAATLRELADRLAKAAAASHALGDAYGERYTCCQNDFWNAGFQVGVGTGFNDVVEVLRAVAGGAGLDEALAEIEFMASENAHCTEDIVSQRGDQSAL
jgi:hypothetical protein